MTQNGFGILGRVTVLLQWIASVSPLVRNDTTVRWGSNPNPVCADKCSVGNVGHSAASRQVEYSLPYWSEMTQRVRCRPHLQLAAKVAQREDESYRPWV